jgi:hypothetical protein
VLFGGSDANGLLGDTWTWDGAAWRIPFVARLHLTPDSGPQGTDVNVRASGFGAFEQVTITFVDSANGKTICGSFPADALGRLAAQLRIPANSTVGRQKITVTGAVSDQKAKATFTVTWQRCLPRLRFE